MDHVIATCFEGDLFLYRNADLETLIREVILQEWDLSPGDLDPSQDRSEWSPELVTAWDNPTWENLEAAWPEEWWSGIQYSGPGA